MVDTFIVAGFQISAIGLQCMLRTWTVLSKDKCAHTTTNQHQHNHQNSDDQPCSALLRWLITRLSKGTWLLWITRLLWVSWLLWITRLLWVSWLLWIA